jgi:hypothetical protein
MGYTKMGEGAEGLFKEGRGCRRVILGRLPKGEGLP